MKRKSSSDLSSSFSKLQRTGSASRCVSSSISADVASSSSSTVTVSSASTQACSTSQSQSSEADVSAISPTQFKSGIWNAFQICEDKENKAECLTCHSVLSHTSGLSLSMFDPQFFQSVLTLISNPSLLFSVLSSIRKWNYVIMDSFAQLQSQASQ